MFPIATMDLPSESHIMRLFNLCMTAISEKLELAVQNAELEAQNVALESKNSALVTQNSALTAQNSALTAQTAALEAQTAALEAQTAALEAQIAQLLVRNNGATAYATELKSCNDMLKRAIKAQHEQMFAEIETLRRANHTMLEEFERKEQALHDMHQSMQQAESECSLIRSLNNPFSWMITVGIHGHLTDLANLLLEHQVNMEECAKLEQEMATLQLLIDEALGEQTDPTEFLEHQNKITTQKEVCFQKRDVFSKRVASCLKTLFEAFVSAQNE